MFALNHTEINGYQIGIAYPEFVVMYLVHKGTSNLSK